MNLSKFPDQQRIIESVLSDSTSAIDLMKKLIAWLRPERGESTPAVCQRIELLEDILNKNAGTRKKLSLMLFKWRSITNFFLAYTTLGLLSRRGFFRELGKRLYEHINPAPSDPNNFPDVLTQIFYKRNDPKWVSEVPDEYWLRLFKILWDMEPEEVDILRRKTIDELLYALEMLSVWVAGEELEPDLVRLEPRIVEQDFAFVALQREISHYCRNYQEWISGKVEQLEDDAHVRVLLEQCIQAVAGFRKKSVTKGTSVDLSYLLERLDQTMKRIHDILDLINPGYPAISRQTAIRLFKELVTASHQCRSVRELVQQNIKLISCSITENTSDHGEHYITVTAREYFAMLRSAAGGGIIIALLALNKIYITGMDLGLFIETVFISLNYGLGFMLIHVLHFTVATKQPAMTASRLAKMIQKGEHGGAKPKMIAVLLIQLIRSQFIAIVGNVSIAFSLALFIGWAYTYFHAAPVLSPEIRDYQIYELRPIASLAVFHACIAGVWLFLSGITAGYFDNRAAYIKLGTRLKEHPLLRRILPTKFRENFADYLHENYGALIGNFFFGILLGGTTYVGYLLGLPIGIRHVAFSSGNLGYAMSTHFPGFLEFAIYGFFIFLISFCNLWVSFGLALHVAFKARNTTIKSFPKLMKAFSDQVRAAPLSLVFPPSNATAKYLE
ncbi:site-specific recombinase [bacterium]|nr:site-specific recombinase [bacterium]